MEDGEDAEDESAENEEEEEEEEREVFEGSGRVVVCDLKVLRGIGVLFRVGWGGELRRLWVFERRKRVVRWRGRKGKWWSWRWFGEKGLRWGGRSVVERYGFVGLLLCAAHYTQRERERERERSVAVLEMVVCGTRME